ncbi:PREDICTED: uncharacterized protein LOC108758714 [Trachymyrmex cornetzi]|uniref:uncharacterized protein LOC108758714 n=1 Tax=Trachymyrmex cornetzi TaxID=471704 RepID=UPI00084F57B5|nr:PREDICTED: uncharacterized protein LOC108758714 [Trachymyrmex cornetzi]
MRIEALSTLVAVVWLTAVLCPRLTAANNLTLSSTSRRPREEPFRGHISRWAEPLEVSTNKRMTYREMQMILRQEGEDGRPVDCCPTIEEMVEPYGGRTREDMYVQLYRDGENVQRFFEYSCRPDIVGKPCRFIDRKFSNQSICVQKYSYTYAIIKRDSGSKEEHRRHHHRERHHFPAFSGNTVSGSEWTLDYILVRSGCSCEITPKPKKKKIAATKTKKTKSKQRQPRDQELDFET